MTKDYKNSVIKSIALEGMVLLKNENNALPLTSGESVAAFGRNFYYCFKGGAGSGDVLGVFPTHPYEAMSRCDDVKLDATVADFYNSYNAEHFDPELKYWNRYNCKWTNSLHEPEIPTTLISEAAKHSKKAIISIGRSSGEWFDVPREKGGFYLTDTELSLIERVASQFKSVILLLNTYGVIETDFIKKYNFDAILYTAMGGSEMGSAVADILLGNTSPSGKLASTWAPIETYPTHEGFQELSIPYTEGIYVGYRYYDSFGLNPDFPFGFGLSYTDFFVTPTFCRNSGTEITVGVRVINKGKFAGKETVQLYLSEPEGKLEKAFQQLATFNKTPELKPSEECELTLCFDLADFACYDEQTAEFILEAGDYALRLGNSSRNTQRIAVISLDSTATVFKTVNRVPLKSELKLISTTPESFITQSDDECPVLELSSKEIKSRTVSLSSPAVELRDEGKFTLTDVRNGTATLEQLVAHLSHEQLADILNGITGKTLGTNLNIGTMAITVEGAAGEIWSNSEYEVPPCINADGPTGIRLGGFIDKEGQIPRDSELSLSMSAFPTATTVANTWNPVLARKMGECISDDMTICGINGWLAPALNIHRNPLCGRNFEYYSEDPVISGVMAAATVLGLQQTSEGEMSGHYATVKHFCANNAEKYRFDSDSIISERALREIYLRGFEIAVKRSKPLGLMNAYNMINGVYASDSYDLNVGILRDEWGYDGCVMTDWGAKSSACKMPHGGCDLVMPGLKNADYLAGLSDGNISLAEAQQCAVNIMRLVLKTTK